jgi:hypothetical protein
LGVGAVQPFEDLVVVTAKAVNLRDLEGRVVLVLLDEPGQLGVRLFPAPQRIERNQPAVFAPERIGFLFGNGQRLLRPAL